MPAKWKSIINQKCFLARIKFQEEQKKASKPFFLLKLLTLYIIEILFKFVKYIEFRKKKNFVRTEMRARRRMMYIERTKKRRFNKNYHTL
jgi:hypothetical protein